MFVLLKARGIIKACRVLPLPKGSIFALANNTVYICIVVVYPKGCQPLWRHVVIMRCKVCTKLIMKIGGHAEKSHEQLKLKPASK